MRKIADAKGGAAAKHVKHGGPTAILVRKISMKFQHEHQHEASELSIQNHRHPTHVPLKVFSTGGSMVQSRSRSCWQPRACQLARKWWDPTDPRYVPTQAAFTSIPISHATTLASSTFLLAAISILFLRNVISKKNAMGPGKRKRSQKQLDHTVRGPVLDTLESLFFGGRYHVRWHMITIWGYPHKPGFINPGLTFHHTGLFVWNPIMDYKNSRTVSSSRTKWVVICLIIYYIRVQYSL